MKSLDELFKLTQELANEVDFLEHDIPVGITVTVSGNFYLNFTLNSTPVRFKDLESLTEFWFKSLTPYIIHGG
jgi:hypothetical protein